MLYGSFGSSPFGAREKSSDGLGSNSSSGSISSLAWFAVTPSGDTGAAVSKGVNAAALGSFMPIFGTVGAGGGAAAGTSFTCSGAAGGFSPSACSRSRRSCSSCFRFRSFSIDSSSHFRASSEAFFDSSSVAQEPFCRASVSAAARAAASASANLRDVSSCAGWFTSLGWTFRACCACNFCRASSTSRAARSLASRSMRSAFLRFGFRRRTGCRLGFRQPPRLRVAVFVRFLFFRCLLLLQFAELRSQRFHFLLELSHVFRLGRCNRLASIVLGRILGLYRFRCRRTLLRFLMLRKRYAPEIVRRLRELQFHVAARRPEISLVHHLAHHFAFRPLVGEEKQLSYSYCRRKLNHRPVFKHQHRRRVFGEKLTLVLRARGTRSRHAHRHFQSHRVRPLGFRLALARCSRLVLDLFVCRG